MKHGTTAHSYERVPTEPSQQLSDNNETISSTIANKRQPVLHVNWRLVLLYMILVVWLTLTVHFLPALLRGPVKREGHSVVYWTPHETGSASIRKWLKVVSKVLNVDIVAARNLSQSDIDVEEEDFHTRHKRMGMTECAFLTGHIKVTSVRERENELQLGAVITTIRDPHALLAAKFFYRTGRHLSKKTVKKYGDATSENARFWFFYWNDYDACEQLRYYDGEDGCDPLDSKRMKTRVRKIAERIDCVVDTDDAVSDLGALCAQMELSVKECPRFPRYDKKKRRARMYSTLLNYSHTMAVMKPALQVTTLLRDELAKRRCRLLSDGLLHTPGVDPPQWPNKKCKSIKSTLDEDSQDDSPENSEADDEMMDVEGGDDEDEDDTEDDNEDEDEEGDEDEDDSSTSVGNSGR